MSSRQGKCNAEVQNRYDWRDPGGDHPLADNRQPRQGDPRSKPNRIQYEYVPPKDAAQQAIYDQMKQGRALENLQQLLSPLRLPYPLTLKVAGCDGAKNAWYGDEVITVCYELLAEIVKNAPAQDLPIGVSRADTVIGAALDIFLHETGHADFNMLQIPVLGREEDAADQFSAYVMLRLSKDEARRMILGSAYHHAIRMQATQVADPRNHFRMSTRRRPSGHSTSSASPMARTRSCLPMSSRRTSAKRRAESCGIEYEDLAFAMTKLIGPYIDKSLAGKFHEIWARTASARRANLKRQLQ